MTVKHGLNRLLGGRGGALRAEDPETDPDATANSAAAEDDETDPPPEDPADGEEDQTDPADDGEDDPEEEAEGEDDTKKEASARKAGYRAGRKAERKRIAGIQNSPEAKGREGLARSLALDTDMDAAPARTVLGKAAKESGGLAAVMAATPNPDVGPDGAGSPGEETAATTAARIAGYASRQPARNQ